MDPDAPLGANPTAWHRHIDPDAWENLYVVGDVHGCLPALDRLLSALAVDADDLVLFVGDLVRRGPDSRGVVERIRHAPNMLAVRGNNEEKLLDGRKELPDLDAEHLDWLASLPAAVSWKGHRVVHGGVHPDRALREQTPRALWNRETVEDGGYWWETYRGPRTFFGHKVLDRPLVGAHAVGLDTGCVYGGALTAFDVRHDRVVSVPGVAHKSSRPAKFLSAPAPAGGSLPTPTLDPLAVSAGGDALGTGAD